MAYRKRSASQIQSTHSTGEMKSVCQFPEIQMIPQITIGDMVNEKEQMHSTIVKRKSIRRQGTQKKWTQLEIKRLHKCIQIFGIDFTLIGKMFPYRTRCQLMSKFKKQDKIHSQNVDKALRANKQMRLSKYVKRQKNIRKQSLVSVNSLDSTDIVNHMINSESSKLGAEDDKLRMTYYQDVYQSDIRKYFYQKQIIECISLKQ